MENPKLTRCLLLVLFFSLISTVTQGTEVCSNTILPGSKGDQGEKGDEGEGGKPGKMGPIGSKGLKGELGNHGDVGMMGKIGPVGDKGDKGLKGSDGPAGFKGKPGTTCDCGRYRKVVGQMDVNISKLRNSVKFVKNVILGIKETEEKFYLIIKEAKKYKDALTNCRLRGGTLAMPKDEETNLLITSSISQAGLSRVFIGLHDSDKEGQFMYVDNTPLQNFTGWSPGEPNNAAVNENCVEMVNTGSWNDVECDLTIYFVCEFWKKRRGTVIIQ